MALLPGGEGCGPSRSTAPSPSPRGRTRLPTAGRDTLKAPSLTVAEVLNGKITFLRWQPHYLFESKRFYEKLRSDWNGLAGQWPMKETGAHRADAALGMPLPARSSPRRPASRPQPGTDVSVQLSPRTRGCETSWEENPRWLCRSPAQGGTRLRALGPAEGVHCPIGIPAPGPGRVNKRIFWDVVVKKKKKKLLEGKYRVCLGFSI